MLTLRPYQEAGGAFLREVWSPEWDGPRVKLNCDEMGLGKTPQAVMALPGELYDEPDPCVLVICPAGLRRVWERHFSDWRPDLKPVRMDKTADLRAPSYGEAVIVSPDALGWAQRGRKARAASMAQAQAMAALGRLQAGLMVDPERTVVIIDEAHRVKGADAVRAQATGAITRPLVMKGGTAWALTATPMPKDASDLINLLRRLGGEASPYAFGGRGESGWQTWARAKRRRKGWSFDGPPLLPLDDHATMGRMLIRRLVRDHLPEIPAPTHEIRLVSISSELSAEADEIMRAGCRACGADFRHAARSVTDAPSEEDDRLLKAIGRDDRGALSSLSLRLAEAKTPHVMEHLKELIAAGIPAVVYSEHKPTIETMKCAGHPVFMGGMSERARDSAVCKFQEGDAAAFGFTGAGREGITLTRAAVFLEADTNWSADDRDQAIGRVVRFGQEGNPSVVHFLADHPIERLKLRTLARKRALKIAALGTSL